MELKTTSNDSTRPVVITPINLTITDTSFLITSSLNVSSGWNLISIPIDALEKRKDQLFPTSTSYAYGYLNNYIIKDTLENGFGYWLKFNSNQEVQILGSSVNQVSVPLRAGWNLIGSLNGSIPINALTTNPPNIISGYIYGYGPNYYIASSIEKGKGYWVKSLANGTLTMNLSYSKSNFVEVNPIDEKWTTLEFSNGMNSARIFIGSDNNFELPPIPPAGVFDVRFNNNSMVSDLQAENIVSINSNIYPVYLTLKNSHGKSYLVTDLINKKILYQTIREGEIVKIDNPMIEKISISEISSKDYSYELMQNYPNPFNPKTIIRFCVPEKSQVTLSIYNSLGEKLFDLSNQVFEPGIHQVEFDGSKLSSGIYFYKMTAGNFTQIRKLILVK
jgi:hypothetical protein